MSSSPIERRRHTRIHVETEVTLLVMFPEETFTPHPMRGITQDLSLSGMRVITYQTSDAFYRLVIKSVRFAKTTLQLPGTGEEVTLHGRIVWVEFDTKQNPPACSYGISFSHASRAEAEALERSLDCVSRQTVAPLQPAAVIRKSGSRGDAPDRASGD
jgi:c-di-GMP-binding flagellar brake protein YcgR